MQDYTGNRKSGDKETGDKTPPTEQAKPKVEKVVTDAVIVKKKGLGRKIKDLFIEADFKSVVRYVAADVLLPAARNMIVDGATKGVERMMYGDMGSRRRYSGAPRITYNNPINRSTPSISRYAPSPPTGPRTRQQDDFILSSREEAEAVLERLQDIIDTYEVASVSDLHELIGFPTNHVDNKWGWSFLGDVSIRQMREGYLIDLPPAEPINSQ